MVKKEIVLKNKFYEYAMVVTEDGHLCQEYFLPLGYEQKPKNQNRLKGMYASEVVLAADFSGEYGCHIGNREYWYEASHSLIFQGYVQDGNTAIIKLYNPKLSLEVQLCYEVYEDSPAIVRYTKLVNHGERDIVLNQVSSFVLNHIPYYGYSEKMLLHTYKSAWAWEGEEQIQSFEALNLFSKFCRGGYVIENNSAFTTVKRFPYVVLEDPENKLFWGVQIENSGQWRLEIGSGDIQNPNWYYLQGGLPNYINSGWSKTLEAGECYVTPKASLTTGVNQIENIYNQMHEHQYKYLIHKSINDKELPVVYNDWQAMNGEVSEERILAQLEYLEKLGIDIYVTDAGWYVPPKCSWSEYVGCWNYDKTRFPNGLKTVAEAIRQHGMLPGIWCEIEVVGKHSKLWNDSEMLLMDHGKFIERSGRRFLNFGSQRTVQYANDTIDSLYHLGFRYIKIDFNADCAPGCDGADKNPVENLHQNRVAYSKWLDSIRKKYPDLIVEHCSSGGMKLDYDNLSGACLASITDQESYLYTASILFNVSRLIHPNQCGNWSNVVSDIDEKTAEFIMTNSMMGRLCISGIMSELSKDVLEVVKKGVGFYKKYRYMIDNPIVHYHTKPMKFKEKQNLKIMEYNDKLGREALLYISSTNFAGDQECKPVLQKYKIMDCYPNMSGIEQQGDTIKIHVSQAEPFGKILFLKRTE